MNQGSATVAMLLKLGVHNVKGAIIETLVSYFSRGPQCIKITTLNMCIAGINMMFLQCTSDSPVKIHPYTY